MASKRKKADTELGTRILRNMARVIEREREKRGLNKKEMAELIEVTYPFYFQILDGTANPSLQTITRVCLNLDLPFQELVSGAAIL